MFIPSDMLKGRDCIGNAKTGSGKTIAFALPILQQLSMDPYGIYALVLTPTRLVGAFHHTWKPSSMFIYSGN